MIESAVSSDFQIINYSNKFVCITYYIIYFQISAVYNLVAGLVLNPAVKVDWEALRGEGKTEVLSFSSSKLFF